MTDKHEKSITRRGVTVAAFDADAPLQLRFLSPLPYFKKPLALRGYSFGHDPHAPSARKIQRYRHQGDDTGIEVNRHRMAASRQP
jgi:hypothetical protein